MRIHDSDRCRDSALGSPYPPSSRWQRVAERVCSPLGVYVIDSAGLCAPSIVRIDRDVSRHWESRRNIRNPLYKLKDLQRNTIHGHALAARHVGVAALEAK